MAFYLRRRAIDLPSTASDVSDDGSRFSNGRPGYVTYGPYVDLQPGRYHAGFELQSVGSSPAPEGEAALDVLHAGSDGPVCTRLIRADSIPSQMPSLLSVTFDIDTPASRVEVRLKCSGSARIRVRGLVIFQDVLDS